MEPKDAKMYDLKVRVSSPFKHTFFGCQLPAVIFSPGAALESFSSFSKGGTPGIPKQHFGLTWAYEWK